uniref:Uncharacterized protein n=1 Tax=Oryza punctata TaxID=4537 RepID=A0A0E0KS34_ORYPU
MLRLSELARRRCSGVVHHDEVVRVEREEVVQLRRGALPAEDPASLRVPATREPLGAHLGLHPRHLLLHDARQQLGRGPDLHAAGVQRRAVPEPVPVLHPADLRRGGVLHQVVQRHGARPGQPRREVLHADARVVAQALHRARPARRLEQVLLCDGGVARRRRVDLVRPPSEVSLEHLPDRRDEPRVRRPRPVVPGAHLPQLVLPHQLQRRLVRCRVVLDRDLRRLHHISNRLVNQLSSRSSPMASGSFRSLTMPPMAWTPRRWQVWMRRWE